MEKYDFVGWATKNDLKCSDGRTIRKDAFIGNDGKTVPLVWNHNHNDPDNILGHALLKNTPEGVKAYGVFNEGDKAQRAKMLVNSGDITSLSIMANQLKQDSQKNVFHGNIREVSLVIAGANPGACINEIITHGEVSDDMATIFTGEDISLGENIEHSKREEDAVEDKAENETLEHADEKDPTVGDVINSMSEVQKQVLYALVGEALDSKKDKTDTTDNTEEGDDKDMKHNVFDNDTKNNENVLTHSEQFEIIKDAKKNGSLKDTILQHGIEDIDMLFPDYKSLNTPPEFIKRDTSWVSDVMGSVHHTPFSRIKSMFADITGDDARALGYVKGNLKKDEVFTLLKRTTDPQTIYKKQKMDRDDVIDITDFDVIGWIKQEMRMMLNEELARAFLVGDGRSSASDDKIREDHIRPIWTDDDLYTIKAPFKVDPSATADDKAKAFIRAAIKARKDYEGSGNPVLFTTEDVLTDCLLLTDEIGRDLYDSVDKLATKLRVRKIVTVPVMEGLQREKGGTKYDLWGIIVNLADYNVGADKGGAVSLFDDFDLDYNKMLYLMETRCSGALIKPKSAIAVELDRTGLE